MNYEFVLERKLIDNFISNQYVNILI